ncbi:MAG: RecT family recombinase [Planctomycetota bacterium]
MTTTARAVQKGQKGRQPTRAPGEEFSHKLVGRLASKFGVAVTSLLQVLRDTVFSVNEKKGEKPFTDSEMAAGLVLCEQYDLNPFAKEIYCTRAKGRLLIIVPIDGWVKIVNRHKDFDGCKFEFHRDQKSGQLQAVTCTMHLKGRSHPTTVTEFHDECFRDTESWRKWPARMLRHKAYIQCARLAYGLSGIVDEDEADRFRDLGTVTIDQRSTYLTHDATAEETLERVSEVKSSPPKDEPPPPAAEEPAPRDPGPKTQPPATAESEPPDESGQLRTEIRKVVAGLSVAKRQTFGKECGDFEKETSIDTLTNVLDYARSL